MRHKISFPYLGKCTRARSRPMNFCILIDFRSVVSTLDIVSASESAFASLDMAPRNIFLKESPHEILVPAYVGESNRAEANCRTFGALKQNSLQGQANLMVTARSC